MPFTPITEWRGRLFQRQLQAALDDIDATGGGIASGSEIVGAIDTQLGSPAWQEGANGYTRFTIWAEENSKLGNNSLEWAFGNGANTPDTQGVVVPVNCELYAGSLSLAAGTATVGIYQDGVRVADAVNGGLTTFVTPISFVAGQTVGFRTITASGTGSPNIVHAHFRSDEQVNIDLDTAYVDGIQDLTLLFENGLI